MSKQLHAIMILVFLVSACAQMKAAPTPQHSIQEPRQTKTVDSHPRTIDDYKTEYARDPKNGALVKEYVKSLEDLKADADRALEEEDYSSAGKDYKILLKNYPSFKGFAHMLSFDRGKLNAKLSVCKEALSKKGFQEYRQGNINQAIILWQGYLSIDPHNADIKKALNTAKLQQKNLQKKQ